MRATAAIGLIVFATMATSGCAASQARTPEPVPLGHVECAQCRMLVSTEVDAAQIVSSSEETRFFDDIGCLAAGWKARHDNATAFVRTAGGNWSDAAAAWFARPQGARTAMGSGLRAYATADQARAADRAGRAMTWDDVVTSVEAPR